MGFDLGVIGSGATDGFGNLLGGFITSLPSILFWTMLGLGTIVIGGVFYLAKKYHYPPFAKYKYRIEYFAPRGEQFVPTFEDKFAVVTEGDNQFLITLKERLILPYEYLHHMLGDKLYARCHNRIEIFPFVPKWAVLKKAYTEQTKNKLVNIADFTGIDDFKEVLNDAPRERFLARHLKSKKKYEDNSPLSKILPYTPFIIAVIFTFLLMTAALEQLTIQFQAGAEIAKTNKETMDIIAGNYKGSPTPTSAQEEIPEGRPY